MAKSNKPKLTINEQIVDMKKKNITFNIVNEQEAKNFLSLLNTLRDNKYEGFSLNNSVYDAIDKLKLVSTNTLNKKMGNRVIHDFIVMLFVFHTLTKDKNYTNIRKNTFNDLKSFLEKRVIQNADYFNNPLFNSYYIFVKNVVDKFASYAL